MDRRLLLEAIGWMLLAVVTVLIRLRMHRVSVGLVAGYIANLWLIHWPAAVTYLLPWYTASDDYLVKAGFEQCFFAIVGFSIGALLIAPFIYQAFEAPRSHTDAAQRRLPDARLPYTYITIAILSYVFGGFLGRIPTVAAMIVGLRQLIVVGICLVLWYAWFAKMRRRFVLALAFTCALPLITIIQEGFLSYGAMALISIMTFTAMFVRPRIPLAVITLIVAYVGFSFYVTYMRDRLTIRGSVWGGQAMTSRVGKLSTTMGNFEWFDPHNTTHIDLVNARLNQNYLVGAAVENLQRGDREFAHGKTVFEAFQALIPRAIWPNKPVQAGSGTIVSEYTGYKFAAGTSVGVGQVMELYINFGTIGVILGFILLGVIVSLFDSWAAQRLWAGDWLQFAMWYLPGLGMMQTGGSLVELAASAGAAMLAVLVVNRYVIRLRLSAAHTVPA